MQTLAGKGDLERFGVAAILNSLADGAYVTDAERTILFWNRAAERIAGWEAPLVVGKNCRDNILVHVDKDGHELCGKEYCPLHRAIVTNQPSTVPMLVYAQRQDGGRVPVEVTVAPLHDRAGRVIGGIEVFRDLSRLHEDLRHAQGVQAHALACEIPADPRVEIETCSVPEGDLGGDFHRVACLDGRRYAAVIADVMGHGIAAALYCMRIRALWDEFSADLTHPARLLRALNGRLHDLVAREGSFVTAVAACYDADTGDLTVARAGHPAPMILDASGGLRQPGGRQPALGLVPELPYEETADHLAPGETLLLYSDGAVEVTDADGAELGAEGLARLLGGQQHADGRMRLCRLEEQLLEYSNRLRLADDLTLVRLARPARGGATPPSPPPASVPL